MIAAVKMKNGHVVMPLGKEMTADGEDKLVAGEALNGDGEVRK